jgi:D-alanyl-D-alanine-carboxypeptidase/D-alanyl-D-alanine-endopeptidase
VADFHEVIRSRLAELVSRSAVPSIAYAIVLDGEVSVGGLGGAGPETVFQIGSVTKGFTGILLADLAGRGLLRLSDPAANYMPKASPGRITLLDLATHTSGLPPLPPGMRKYALLRPSDPYSLYPVATFLRTARRSLASAPGGVQPYRYSNYGFGLLGHLLGQAGAAAGGPGQSDTATYPALVEQRICGPLGLRGTGFDAVATQGHRRGRPVPDWRLGALAAAGGLYSTAADLAKLLIACLTPGESPLEDPIRVATQPHRVVGPGVEIGLAWHHAVKDDQRVIWHNGMTGGFSAMVAVNRARRAGVAALANSSGIGVPPSPLDAPILDALGAAAR